MNNDNYQSTYEADSPMCKAITLYYGHDIVGQISKMQYSVTREMTPIYTMGNADPRCHGQRGIAGYIILDNAQVDIYEEKRFDIHIEVISHDKTEGEYIINGCEFLNIQKENQHVFVARGITPLKPKE